MAHAKIDQTIEDAIIKDHREVKQCYNDYKRTGDVKFYNQFVWELCRHSIGEEICVYPLLDKFGDQSTTELKSQHAEANQMLKSMESMEAGSQLFNNTLDKLMKALEEHIEHEEKHDLEILKKNMETQDRISLGTKFANRKKIAPTRPHTVTPQNYPTLEEALAVIITPIDKFRDLFVDFPEEAPTGAAHSSGGGRL